MHEPPAPGGAQANGPGHGGDGGAGSPKQRLGRVAEGPAREAGSPEVGPAGGTPLGLDVAQQRVQERRQRRRARSLPARAHLVLLPLSVLPFLVMLVALVADRPAITPYGDRAVTALAVRDVVGGHQLLGAYSRYGWHHPGPAFFLPLAAADLALGGVHWALNAGMLAMAMASVALVVTVVLRAAGSRAAFATAGVIGLYVHAVGPATFRDPWNPWGLLLPLALLTVLGAAASAGSAASLASAVLVATWLVQTHVGAAPVSLAILVTACLLGWWARWRRPVARARSPWRQPAVWAPLLGAVALWVAPVVQEATGADPNLSELWRFFVNGHPGHSLSTAVATVGNQLAELPWGSSHALSRAHPPVGWDHVGTAGLVVAGYLVVALVLTIAGHRLADPFARSLGVLTMVAVVVAVVAVRSIQGPLDGFLVAWVTAIPLGCWVGVACLIPRRPLPAGWWSPARPERKGAGVGVSSLPEGAGVGGTGGRAALVPALALSLSAGIALTGVIMSTTGAAAAPSAAHEDAPAVTRAWRQLWPHLIGRPPGAVLIRVTDIYGWPVQAGLALAIEEHGWSAHVTDDWVFMFGAQRRATGNEPVVATLRVASPPGPAERLIVDVTTVLPTAPPGALSAAATRVGTALTRGPAPISAPSSPPPVSVPLSPGAPLASSPPSPGPAAGSSPPAPGPPLAAALRHPARPSAAAPLP